MKIDRELNQFIGISSLSEKYFSVESEVFLPQVKVCVRRERGADRESLSIGSSTTGIISGNITVLTHSLGRVRWDFVKEWEIFLCLSETYFFVWVRNISFFEWEIFLCLDDKYSSERGRCQYISIISKPKYIWSHLFPVIYDVWSWLIYIWSMITSIYISIKHILFPPAWSRWSRSGEENASSSQRLSPCPEVFMIFRTCVTSCNLLIM